MMYRRRPPVRSTILLGMVLLFAVPTVAGHAYLDSSTPPPNGSLSLGAGVAALRFTELVDPDHTRIALHADDGTLMDTQTMVPSQRPDEVRIQFAPLSQGEYTLHWSVLGVDGHTASGHIRFNVGDGAVSQADDATAFDPEGVSAKQTAWEAVGRTMWMAGLLVVLGVPVFVSEIAEVRAPPRRVAVAMSVAGLTGLVGGAIQSVVLAQAITASWWTAAASTPGMLLLGKMALLLAATVLALIASRAGPRHRGWALASMFPAFVATVMHSMGGHGLLAPASGEGVAGHVGMTLHLVVAALWLGGVVGFILLLPDLDRVRATDLIHRFSPLAMASVVVVAATGLHQALIHFPPGAEGDLYLGLLLAKVALLIVLVGFGAWHLYWLRPRLDDGHSGHGLLRRSLPAESTFLVAVVAVAGLLAAVPVPAAPPGLDGPLAVEESEGRLGDYTAKVMVLGNPVASNASYDLVITLHALTSRGVEQATFEAQMVSPTGSVVSIEGLLQENPGVWTVPVRFTEPGEWSIQLDLLGPSRDTGDFTVRVVDLDNASTTA